MNAVTARGLGRSFGTTTALRDLDLDVREGELLGLIGPDGAGKTTALRIVAGVLKPDRGTVQVFGRDPAATSSEVRGLIGYMPQRYSLYGDLSIGENLHFFGDLFGLTRQEFRERTSRLLAITRLAPFVNRRAQALSGGMYKKLALACALLHRPRLLILDEPTNGVDPISRIELWDLLNEFVSEGMAVVVSTSYMDEALRCARIVVQHKGHKLIEGAPAELVNGFGGAVWRIGVAGLAADRVLEPVHAHVVGITPLGKGTRVVTDGGFAVEFEKSMRAQGVTVERMAPSFEDLFLELVAAGEVGHG